MRYKEFNTQRVLEDCISLFWDNGFGACAINDIVSKTNVNRFSLYQEFENKEGILHQSMQLYEHRYSTKQQELLLSNKPIKTVLKEFFISFLSDSNTHPPGDYILHIATELADTNIKVKNTLDAYLNKLQVQFELLLQKHAETKIQSVFLAKHVTALFCTSMCYSVIHPYKNRISLVDNGLNILLNNNTTHATNA